MLRIARICFFIAGLPIEASGSSCFVIGGCGVPAVWGIFPGDGRKVVGKVVLFYHAGNVFPVWRIVCTLAIGAEKQAFCSVFICCFGGCLVFGRISAGVAAVAALDSD